MTVLVALATKDALVLGCDSLGTIPKVLVDPLDLISEFFDPENEWNLKVGNDGKTILQDFHDIYKKARSVPFDHMTHVTKIFSLAPLEIGVMQTGIVSIGDRTIKSLINEFKSNEPAFNNKKKPTNYTVKSIGKKLLNFINKFFKEAYPNDKKPHLEFMIGGYDKQKQVPSIYRIYFHENRLDEVFIESFGIAFAGQMQEIQRIVFGIDGTNSLILTERAKILFDKYRELSQKYLEKKGITEELPRWDVYKNELSLLKDLELNRFDAEWGDFSEQNAIECVNFFVEIMIKSQQFSRGLPTVGGAVHIGLITKKNGFQFISKEEYEHEGFTTPAGGQK
jgi:20S proteasome alpha/beta subunit